MPGAVTQGLDTSPTTAERDFDTEAGKPPFVSTNVAQQVDVPRAHELDEALDVSRDEIHDGNVTGSHDKSPSREHQLDFQDQLRSKPSVDLHDESRTESYDSARPEKASAGSEQVKSEAETPDVSNLRKEYKPRSRLSQPRRGTFFHHESLGHVSLGIPAAALLTTDLHVSKGRRKPEPKLKLIDEAELTGEPLQCQNVFEHEQESEEEVMKRLRQNIDELRPKDTTSLRETGLRRLAKKLTEGFTSQQLSAYYKEDAAHGLRTHGSSMPSYPWIVQHQPWEAIRSMTLDRLKPKMRQAIRIITETWKVDVEEQVEGQGTMTIKLKPDAFKLIAQPSSSLLKGLSNMYFDPSNHERISHYPDTHQLSIYCRRSTAFTILARMDEMLGSQTTKRVSVKNVDEDNLTETALDELGRITNTLLKYHSRDSELSISWIPEDEGTTATEDIADSILRLLSNWQPPASVNKVHILPLTGESNGKELTFVTHHRDFRALSWRDKLREWSRCVSPISIRSVERRVAMAAPMSNYVSFPKTKVWADHQTTYHLSATFGHILHLRPHVRTAKMANNHRVLSPLVPHPASLVTLKAKGAEEEIIVDQSTDMILNFVPDLAAIGDDAQQAPPPRIRLRLPVRGDADLSASSLTAEDSSLEAVIPSITHDVLLPAEMVDARLCQEQTLTLDPTQASIRDFLAKSDLSSLQGNVKTPSRITLSIPTSLLSTPDKSNDKKKRSRKTKSDPSSPTKQTTEIPYLFNGLELHQTIEIPHRENNHLRLRYSTIEAGHQGGRRQQLSLHAPASSSSNDDKTASFLDAVYDVAVGRLFPWYNGHRLMQKKKKEKFKKHMLDQTSDYDEIAEDVSWEDSDPPSGTAPPFSLVKMSCITRSTPTRKKKARLGSASASGRAITVVVALL
ncbi:hypothetical protein CP533_5051 [Ophiocordyceps camponoti-saundersi (nom. inval.)]|nr:hypothetical protein CP533_5051 [Ophiocordyceps camponoti-saundersi (nom. inval.)]